MNKFIIFCSVILCVDCSGCDLDNIMINGSKWKDTKLFELFKTDKFDYDLSYHNFNEIITELKWVNKTYPDIINLLTIGLSAENREIYAVIVSNNSMKGNTIVFECGIHAREWISVSFCLWTVNKLINEKPFLNEYQFLIIPVLNPDGYVYSWETERFWRKSRSHHNLSSCRGIDLNRNWATNDFCIHAAEQDPCDEQYCGDQPFSTPEIKALSNYLLANKQDIFAYFAIHSYSQLWMYPWGYKNESVPNSSFLEKLSSIGVKSIHRLYGTEYKFGSFLKFLYPASGVSLDWVYDTLNVKIAFAIELRDQGNYGFLLPCHLIKPTCEEIWAGIDAVLQYLINEYRINFSHKPFLNILTMIFVFINLLIIA